MSGVRKQLEALAQTLVQRSGLRELSFRQLADQTGIKSSSVHYYFPEKNDLTAALIKTYSQAFAARLQAIDDAEATLRRKLLAFVDLFAEAAADDRLCLCGMLAAELTSLDSDCRALLDAFFKDSEGWLAGVLKRHKNEVLAALPANKLAAAVMSGLEGALLLDRVDGSGSHLQAQRLLVTSFTLGRSPA